MITLDLAGIPIALDHRYPYIEEISRDYLTTAAPVITLSLTDHDLQREERLAGRRLPPAYAESAAFHRKAAQVLPSYGAIVFHAAVLTDGGRAYAIAAKSGVGKTTHIRLWKRAYGERIGVLNGDKPIFRLEGGVVYAYGTPWRGKEGYGTRGRFPLSAIAFLERGEQNGATPLSPDTATARFLAQTYLPKTPDAASLSLALVGKILTAVPLFLLRCNTDVSAALVARAAFAAPKNNF